MSTLKNTNICINCGKIINPRTLICDACGTNYGEECEHLFSEYRYTTNPIDRTVLVLLKCSKCENITHILCTEDMIKDIFERGFEL